jgi:hypothetical protein
MHNVFFVEKSERDQNVMSMSFDGKVNNFGRFETSMMRIRSCLALMFFRSLSTDETSWILTTENGGS